MVQDRKEGVGTYLFADSDARLKGEWEGGEITRGEFIHKDGVKFSGHFAHGKFLGNGVFAFKQSGLQQCGKFVQVLDEETDLTQIRWMGGEVEGITLSHQ